MKSSHFPEQIRGLPLFEGRFEAHRLAAKGCDVLFASYPAGTVIESHAHDTENLGVITAGELILETDEGTKKFGPGDWYQLAPHQRHAARFEVDTSEIEFWFQQ